MPPSISTLESRCHLAAHPLFPVDGLPRQLTAVGDVLYFLRDSGKDGYLKYDAIVAHDVDTGVEQRVLRDNGKAFGDGKYRLESDGRRLFISESGGAESRLWAIAPGDKRARLIRTGAAIDAATPLLIPSGSTTYIRTPDGVDALGKNDTVAHNVFSTKAFDKTAEIGSVLSWQGRLVVTFGWTQIGRILISDDNGVMRESRPPVAKHENYSFGAVRVAGKNIVVEKTGDHPALYYMSDLAKGFAEMPDVARYGRWKATGVNVLGVVGNDFVFQPRGNTYAIFKTDFTTRGTASLRSDRDLLGGKIFGIGSEIYAATYDAAKPFDPETAGPPSNVPTINLVQDYNGGPGSYPNAGPQIQGPQGTGIIHLDFTGGTLSSIFSVQAARDFVAVGDHVYFMGRVWKADAASNNSDALLYVTDGHETRRVTTAFESPVVVGGKVAYTTSFDNREVTTESIDTGEISGRITRSDRPTSLSDQQPALDNFSPNKDWKVFLDLDNDSKRDSNEPATGVDAAGEFHFSGLKPTGGKKITVALQTLAEHWTAVDGLSASVRVRAGGVSKLAFRFKDGQRSATIDGIVLTSSSDHAPVRNARVWLATDSVWGFDAGEPFAITDENGLYHFDHVTAGKYSIVSSSGQVQPETPYASATWVTVPVGGHVKLMGGNPT